MRRQPLYLASARGRFSFGAVVAVTLLTLGCLPPCEKLLRQVCALDPSRCPRHEAEMKRERQGDPARASERCRLVLSQGGGKVELAKTQAAELRAAVVLYWKTNKRLPTSLEEVQNDLEGKKVPLDPWRRPYVYARTLPTDLRHLRELRARRESAPSIEDEFNIHSMGPDGYDGTEDDIRAKSQSLGSDSGR